MKRIIGFISLLCIAQLGLAKEIVFSATVNKNKVALGDYFEITFRVENINPDKFAAPSFKDFSVLSGPNQSTSMQIVNGNMSRSVAYSYYLQPKKEGSFEIPSATFVAAGKTYNSNKVKIEVVKKNSNTSASNNAVTSKQQSGGEQISDENIFLKVYVDKTNVYEGEQVTATFKLFTRVSISAISDQTMPKLTGFWTTDIEAPAQLSVKTENINGVEYKTALIRKVALFPQRSGTLEIDPYKMETVIQVRRKRRTRRSIFDDFFDSGYQQVKKSLATHKINIKVKPLPKNNRPLGYNGAVGRYTMQVTANNTETKTNEPISIKIKISGTGNLKIIDEPVIDIPTDFEAYDPKVTERIPKGVNPVRGSKTYEYLLIPRRAGEYKLPPVQFSYFDLKQHKYVTQNSNPITIKVSKGEGEVAIQPNVTAINKEDVELLGEDIRFIKTGDSKIHAEGTSFIGSPIFYGLTVSPFVLFIGLILFRRKVKEEQANVALVRNKKATGIARKKLKTAKSLMAGGDDKAFYDEVVKAIWGYLGDKLTINQAELSKENVASHLQAKGVGETYIQRIKQLIDSCELALYAPSSVGTSKEETYQQSVQLLSDIEKDLG